MPAMAEAFTQDLAARIAGLSRRQLEYWDQIDLIKPSIAPKGGWGMPRLYSFRDLIKLKVAARMRRKVRPSDIKLTIDALEERGFEDPLVTIQFVETQSGGRLAWIHPATGELLDAHHGLQVDQTVQPFDLNLRDLRTGLEESIHRITARRHGKVTSVRNLQGSQTVIEGTRVPTAKIAGLRAAGWSVARILAAFPALTAEDVSAALRHEQRRKQPA
ncbi:MAG: DUF433 domain-containing protein [Chloroflexi bacterium]|nr:DUF433 domain-containing protein [Chloroflexota bacterium]